MTLGVGLINDVNNRANGEQRKIGLHDEANFPLLHDEREI